MTKNMRNHLNWQMIKKKLEGKLSASEEQHFQHWLQQSPERQLMMDDLQQRWQKQGEDVNDAFQALKERIIFNERLYAKRTGYRTWYYVAASFLLIGLVSLVYIFVQDTTPTPKISYLEKTTVVGQTATVSLSDGSVVMLNSRSKLIYPESFSSQPRTVYLQGEGFFEVQSDTTRPFTVHTGNIITTVLGTSFNIKELPSGNPEVTVLTGKVQVHHSQQESTLAYLSPGQQAIYDQINGELITRQVDLRRHIAWMKRQLNFQKITFSEAMRQLGRVYNMDVQIINGSTDCLIRAKYENESLENVLKGLQLIVKFEYEIIDESKIIIDVKECIN